MSASSERMSVFGPTLRFKGELRAQEDIKIEGRIEGSIHHQQRVVVGNKGEVVASVNAQSIDVDGKVQGDITARKSVKVSQSAVVRGNIRITQPFITLAGQTAPGAGITVEGMISSFDHGVHDIIIRHLRVRPRRAWVRVRETGGRTVVEVAGLDRSADTGAGHGPADEVASIAAALEPRRQRQGQQEQEQE